MHQLYSRNKIPPQLKELCHACNSNYLIMSNDSKLNPISIWRYIYDRTQNTIPSPALNTAHETMYIQEYLHSHMKCKTGIMKQHTPMYRRIIDMDFMTIADHTTILQSKGTNIMYLVTDLHCRHHGLSSVT